MKKFRNSILNVMAGSAIVGCVALVASLVLGFYSFVAYPQCYFTTHPDYSHLENTAPILWDFIFSSLVIVVASLLLVIGLRYLYIATRKKRR